MRVYEKRKQYRYPEDMKKILDYLHKHGTILVKEYTIEDLYRKFSKEKYSAGWICVNDNTLRYFEDWLCNYEY